MLASYLILSVQGQAPIATEILDPWYLYSTNHHLPFGDSVFQKARLWLPFLSPCTHHQLDHQSCEVSQFPVMIEQVELKAQDVFVILEIHKHVIDPIKAHLVSNFLGIQLVGMM